MYIYGHVDIRAVTAVLMEGEGCLRSFFVVIESREDAVRTLFENCLPRVKESLSRIEDVGVLVYSKRYHDLCTEYTSFLMIARQCREVFIMNL